MRSWKSNDPYPQGSTFGELLDWHLWWGTRPGYSKVRKNPRWAFVDFAQAVHLGVPATGSDETPAKKLSFWRDNRHLPKNDIIVQNIFEQLFGDDPDLVDWKRDLQEALERERKAKAGPTPKRSAANSTETLKASIPWPTAHFVGRDHERDALAKALASSEVSAILIQGGPGIGKTELTKAIAHHADVAARFSERRYFVALETAASAEAMQHAIVRAIGGDPQYGVAAALNTLHGSQTLLVLDNLETPWQPHYAAAEQALADLAAIPGVAILASFRGREAVGGACWRAHEVQTLPPEHAAALFAAIAGDWVRDDPHLPSFITALGGIPLAITLVAHRAHGRASLAPLWREWKKIGAALATRAPFESDRLTSLTASIELSLNSPRMAKDADALRLLGFLGHLPSGIRIEDRNALIGDGTYNAEECLLHSGLAIEREGRIDLLPPVREYARRHIHLSREDVLRWVMFYQELDSRFSASIEKYETFRPDFGNMEAARIYFDYLSSRDRRDEAHVRFQNDQSDINKAEWLLICGDISWRLLNYDNAKEAATEALSLFCQAENLRGQADSLYLLGQISLHLSEFIESLSFFEKSYDFYEQIDQPDKRGEIDCALYISDLRPVVQDVNEGKNSFRYAGWRYLIPQEK